jgi:hypothetical protein
MLLITLVRYAIDAPNAIRVRLRVLRLRFTGVRIRGQGKPFTASDATRKIRRHRRPVVLVNVKGATKVKNLGGL